MTAFAVHTLVLAVLIAVLTMVMRSRMESRLGVVISILCMAVAFWSVSAMEGGTAGVGESWLAIGFVCGCYCVRTRHDPGGK